MIRFFLLAKASVLLCVFSMLLLSASVYGHNNEEIADADCAIKGYDSKPKINKELIEGNIDLREVSTEGGVAKLYFDKNRVAVIKSTIFGETGKIEIDYYFGMTGYSGSYFVEMRRYRYSRPIYIYGSEVASLSIHKFSVCNYVASSYPDKNELKEEYEVAEKMLSEIRSSMSRPKESDGN